MDLERLTEIWADFVYEGKMSPEVREPIADSWRKCRAAGLNPAGGAGNHVDERVLKSICAANKELIEVAQPVMESVYEIVKKTHYLLVLTDANGYILETMGDEDIIRKSADMRFVKGAFWGTLDVGTNAISLALDYDIPIQTVGPEHYCVSHHGWTCSAAPIHGYYGELMGCINISGDVSTVNEHSLGLVLASAYSIEAQIKLRHSISIISAALDSSTDGILLLDSSYRTFWMNGSARMLMGADLQQMKKRNFSKLFPNVDWKGSFLDGSGKFYCEDAKIMTGNGLRHFSLVINRLIDYGSLTWCVTLRQRPVVPGKEPVPAEARSRSMETHIPKLTDSEKAELAEIKTVLDAFPGNIGRAAEELGISRATLYRRLKKYGISSR